MPKQTFMATSTSDSQGESSSVLPRVAMLPQVTDAALPFPIVGIGASAGGLEALEAFFHACLPEMGMAFVLVSHLAPDHHSLLSEILQRCI